MDNTGLGISFAPTAQNAQDSQRSGALDGIPQAIRILSLHMPRILGARALAPDALMNAPGGNGMDPYLSALFQTLSKTMAPQTGMPQGPGPMPEMPQNPQPGQGAPPPRIFQPLPGGTAGPNPAPPERPSWRPDPQPGPRRTPFGY